MLSVERLTPAIGAEITGVDLGQLDDTTAAQLSGELHRHGVLVVRNQSLDRDAQLQLAARFGEVRGHPVAEFARGSADPLSVVYNDAEKLPQGDQHFHVDYSFNDSIPNIAILRAEVVPDSGGDTQWSNAGAAFDALSPWMQAALDGLVAEHDAGEKFWYEMYRTQGEEFVARARAKFAGNAHPVIARHPVTGRRLLFVNEGYTRRIVGVQPFESEALLRMLFELIENPDFHYRHRWRPGDVVFWDEHLTTHKGPNDFAPATRCLTRVTAGHSAPRAA